MKKKYIPPTCGITHIVVSDTLFSSGVEEFSSYIDGPGDWGEDPIFDPDDEIIW